MTPTNWWQPEAPDRALSGVLFEDGEDGWHLELEGSFTQVDLRALAAEGKSVFLPIRLPDAFPVIIGVNKGKLMSLMRCQPVSSSIAFAGTRGSLKLWPTTIVHGVHFDSYEDFSLLSLSVRYKHLDAWVATSGFQVNLDTAFRPTSITYAKPEPFEAILSDDLKLCVEFSASGPRMPVITRLEMTQDCWLTIRTRVPMPYEELVSQLSSFADLISLFTGQPLTPIAMLATCRAKDETGQEIDQDISIIDNRKPIAPVSAEEVRFWDILFTFPDLRPRLNKLVQAWFARDASLQSLYDLYFGGLHGPARYVEQRFLNIFQALESYHRRSSRPEPVRQAKRDERLKRILESVQGKDQKWLADKLRFSHEPSAEERLRSLVESVDASWLLGSEQIAVSAILRNYYTHFDPQLEVKLPATKVRYRIMLNLTTRLRVLCEMILLDAIGLGKDEV